LKNIGDVKLKVILKLKEHLERKNILKDISKYFKDLGNNYSKIKKEV